LRIKVSKQLEANIVELSDLSGRQVLPKAFISPSHETLLNLKTLETGTYILSIPTNKGIIRQKIVKQ
jgi:Secretion system C-terminal sorting domain